jgi:general secretion pathway protein F
MAEYRFEAVDENGAARRGKLQAPDAASVRNTLRARGFLPVHVEPTGLSTERGHSKALSRVRRPINAATLSGVTRQLATLLANDIRIEDALSVTARQGVSVRTAGILQDVRNRIVDGQSFAGALAQQGRSFPRPYIAAVAAGEASGRLDTVLGHLAQHTEEAWTNRRTIILALIYPGFLALVSAVIITLLMTQVVPDILGVYQRRATELPAATQVLVALSQGLRTTGPALIAFSVLAAAGAAWFRSTRSGNLYVAAQALRFPVIGTFLKQKHAAQIASTLAILVQSGVPLVRALSIAAEVSGNTQVQNLFHAAASDVGDGAPLDAALARTGILPQMMLSMIAGGIRSGQLGAALAWTGRDVQAALDRKLKALTALIEPVVLLVMGGIILFIVMAILTPITRLNALAGS